ncbi:hypothetical protein SNE40_002611 [Patella caerulea]|uniref:Secreted protein n=1 Tax=Patella caerulea TaxID=87958 RepID=A0AAN8PZD9_PATCE
MNRYDLMIVFILLSDIYVDGLQGIVKTLPVISRQEANSFMPPCPPFIRKRFYKYKHRTTNSVDPANVSQRSIQQ